MTQDMRIVAACPVNKSSALASPRMEENATGSSKPVPVPPKKPVLSQQAIKLENFSLSVRDLSQKYGSPSAPRTEALHEQHGAIGLAVPQQELPIPQDEQVQTDTRLARVTNVSNSPLGAQSKAFMQSVSTRPFDPNIYGAPPETVTTAPGRTIIVNETAQILKVPVLELGQPQPVSVGSMPIDSAFTDGNPTPATLSTFSGGTSPLTRDDTATCAETAQDPSKVPSLLGLAIDFPQTTTSTAPKDRSASNLARSTSGQGIDLMSDYEEPIVTPILEPGPAYPPRVIKCDGHLYHLILPGDLGKDFAAETLEARSSSEKSFTTAEETSPQPEAGPLVSPLLEQQSLGKQSASDDLYTSRGIERLDYDLVGHATASGIVPCVIAPKRPPEATHSSKQTLDLNTKLRIAEARSTLPESSQVSGPKPVNPFKHVELKTETTTTAKVSTSKAKAGPEVLDAQPLATSSRLGPQREAAVPPKGFAPNLLDTKCTEHLSESMPVFSVHDKFVQSKRHEAKQESLRSAPVPSIHDMFVQSKSDRAEQEASRSTPYQTIHDKFVEPKKSDGKQDSGSFSATGDSRAKRSNSPQKGSKHRSAKRAGTKFTGTGDEIRSHTSIDEAHSATLAPIFGDERNLRYRQPEPAASARVATGVPDNTVMRSGECDGRLVGPFHNLNLQGGEHRALVPQLAPTTVSGMASIHTGRVSAKAHCGLTPVVGKQDVSDTESELL